MKKKCEVCNKPAKWLFSPDMDISGLGSCDKHKMDVTIAYHMLITEGEKEYHNMIDSYKKRDKHLLESKKTVKKVISKIRGGDKK